tara:strand:- start:316 stop:465 length:150 start_codon:yes stop_codon:yes gene_type:complete
VGQGQGQGWRANLVLPGPALLDDIGRHELEGRVDAWKVNGSGIGGFGGG